MGMQIQHAVAKGRSGAGGIAEVADAAPALARQLAAEAKVEARTTLKPHHAAFIRQLVAGVEAGERTAMNLYPRVAGMLDADADLADAFREFFRALRVRDEAELRRAVELAQSAESVTQEQADQQWAQYGRRRIKAAPEFRSWAREVLFGEREVDAEHEPGRNGHTNGNGKASSFARGATNGRGEGSES